MSWQTFDKHSPVLKRYKQQKQHIQFDVAIHKDANVTVNGYPPQNPREFALASIIIRLNAYANVMDKYVDKMDAFK